jgi:flagella basal body P-ring formation protein FlgA
MDGEAMQSGGLGQHIAVRQAGFDKKRYTGTIVGAGLVEVHL